MKKINKKKNNGSAPYRRCKPSGSGFVILFAVTLSAILLSIALGVANISLKEVSFSISGRDSNDAFLAADTGAECALFNDKLAGSAFPVEAPPVNPFFITCNSVAPIINNVPVIFSVDPITGASWYDFIITGLGSDGDNCAEVRVSKDASVTPVDVKIFSKGYNIGDPNCDSESIHRVERELVISSSVGALSAYAPAAAVVHLKFDGVDRVDNNVPFSIESGSVGTLSWDTTSVTRCNATGGDLFTGPKSWGYGYEFTENITLPVSKTYTLTCDNGDGTPSVSDYVIVNPY